MRVSEIHVKQIRVNQGLGVPLKHRKKYGLIDYKTFKSYLNQDLTCCVWYLK